MSLSALAKRAGLIWLVCLAALNYVAYLRIGGPTLPDLHLTGANADQIRASLSAFTFETRLLYLRTYLPLDFLFIAVTVALAAMLARLWGARLVWVAVLVFAVADVAENLMLRQMAQDLSLATCLSGCEAEFARLTMATRVKFLGFLAVIGLLALAWWRRRNGGAHGSGRQT